MQLCALLCAFPTLCAAFVVVVVEASADGCVIAVERRLQVAQKSVGV